MPHLLCQQYAAHGTLLSPNHTDTLSRTTSSLICNTAFPSASLPPLNTSAQEVALFTSICRSPILFVTIPTLYLKRPASSASSLSLPREIIHFFYFNFHLSFSPSLINPYPISKFYSTIVSFPPSPIFSPSPSTRHRLPLPYSLPPDLHAPLEEDNHV